jgi:hypothetical protein
MSVATAVGRHRPQPAVGGAAGSAPAVGSRPANLGGVALFLFGTTYVWTTPAFGQALGPGPSVLVRRVGVDGPAGDALVARPRES